MWLVSFVPPNHTHEETVMPKRYTVVMQVCEVDEQGQTVECFEPLGPTWASTNLEQVTTFAYAYEELMGESFPEHVDEDSITELYPGETDEFARKLAELEDRIIAIREGYHDVE
jgi:hypothetical protein